MSLQSSGNIDMRHTKLKPEEAALIAGELVKPSWASRNEGIHERVSFEDTLWGFELAGGAYYKTPLRVVYVKPDSRAEHACIKLGDVVLRINGIETSTLTLQEAHELIVSSGINLRIAVTSPDDLQDAHYCYEDPTVGEPTLSAEQLKELEAERVRRALERASRCKNLPWPWVRRKIIIYRESNCFMVPSKYEDKHRELFPELPMQKIDYFFPNESQQIIRKTSKSKNKEDSEKGENNVDINKSGVDGAVRLENGITEDGNDLDEVDDLHEDIDEEASEEAEVADEMDEHSVDEQKQDPDERIDNDRDEDEYYDDERSEQVPESEPDEASRHDIEETKDSNFTIENNFDQGHLKNEISDDGVLDNTTDVLDNSTEEDIMFDELAGNSNEINKENISKSDDDVLDSIITDSVGTNDTVNER